MTVIQCHFRLYYSSISATLRLRQKYIENRSSNTETEKLEDKEEIQNLEALQQRIDEESTETVESSEPIDSLIEQAIQNDRVEPIIEGTSPAAVEHSENQIEIDRKSIEVPHEDEASTEPKDCSDRSSSPVQITTTGDQATGVKRRISIEPFHSSAHELIDVKSKNFLNICARSENSKELISNKDVGKSLRQTLNEKPRPLIEVISDSDSTDLSEIEDINISDEKSTNETNIISTDEPTVVLTSQIEGENSPDAQGEKQLDNICLESVIESQQKMSKSTAITFFCENLDELKTTGSDSDSDSEASVEEI